MKHVAPSARSIAPRSREAESVVQSILETTRNSAVARGRHAGIIDDMGGMHVAVDFGIYLRKLQGLSYLSFPRVMYPILGNTEKLHSIYLSTDALLKSRFGRVITFAVNRMVVTPNECLLESKIGTNDC